LFSLKADARSRPNRVRYPGEKTLRLRGENMGLAIPVDPALESKFRKCTKIVGFRSPRLSG
jgi:hypothetical protein